MKNRSLVRGDVITSELFSAGCTLADGGLRVGVQRSSADNIDESRGDARFLVVHVSETCITALRLDNCKLGEAIVFDTNIAQVQVLGNYDLAPVQGNAALILRADDQVQATRIASSLLGFVPTTDPVLNQGNWTVEGVSFRPVTHRNVVSVCELITANSARPLELFQQNA